MLILGVDPGIAISGYGIIEKEQNGAKVLDYGVIRTDAKLDTAQRLKIIYESYLKLIEKYKPSTVAVEELFFNKNAKTIISVSQARGAALLAAALSDLEVSEYTPLQVKQSVVGYGRASKAQVQEMVKLFLKLDEIPKPDDAADALAVAICHLHSYKLQSILDGRGY